MLAVIRNLLTRRRPSADGEPSAPQLEAPDIYVVEIVGDGVSININNVENATSYTIQRRSQAGIAAEVSDWETLATDLSSSFYGTAPEQWVRYDYRAIAKAEGYLDSEPSNVVRTIWLPTDTMSSFMAAASYFEWETAAIGARKITNYLWPETTHTYEAKTTAGTVSVTGTIAEGPALPIGVSIYVPASHVNMAIYVASVRRLLPDGAGGFAQSNWATYEYQFYPPE